MTVSPVVVSWELSSVREAEAEESSLLDAVARERLMKLQQAGKRCSGCYGDFKSVEISDSAVIPCSYESCLCKRRSCPCA
jgi:hypothetical protein